MRSAWKNFGITFGIATLIFALVAYLLVGFLTDAMSPVVDAASGLDNVLDTGDGSTADPEQPADPWDSATYGQSFNLLVIGTDYQPNVYPYYSDIVSGKYDDAYEGLLNTDIHQIRADSAVLIRVSRETKQFTFTALPTETRLFINSAYTTLGDVYATYGLDFYLETVHNITGLDIDYYAVVNVTDAPSVMNLIGAVNVDIPCNIYVDNSRYSSIEKAAETGEDGEEIPSTQKKVLSAGKQAIDASNVAAMLLCSDYDNASASRAAVLENFMQAVCAKLLKEENSASAQGLFSSLSQYMKTNLTSGVITDNLGLIYAYTRFESFRLSYPGTYKTVDGKMQFIPSTDEAVQNFYNYRKPLDSTAA